MRIGYQTSNQSKVNNEKILTLIACLEHSIWPKGIPEDIKKDVNMRNNELSSTIKMSRRFLTDNKVSILKNARNKLKNAGIWTNEFEAKFIKFNGLAIKQLNIVQQFINLRSYCYANKFCVTKQDRCLIVENNIQAYNSKTKKRHMLLTTYDVADIVNTCSSNVKNLVQKCRFFTNLLGINTQKNTKICKIYTRNGKQIEAVRTGIKTDAVVYNWYGSSKKETANNMDVLVNLIINNNIKSVPFFKKIILIKMAARLLKIEQLTNSNKEKTLDQASEIKQKITNLITQLKQEKLTEEARENGSFIQANDGSWQKIIWTKDGLKNLGWVNKEDVPKEQKDWWIQCENNDGFTKIVE